MENDRHGGPQHGHTSAIPAGSLQISRCVTYSNASTVAASTGSSVSLHGSKKNKDTREARFGKTPYDIQAASV
ncbi:hypothetical protein PANT_5c00051 [Moesziomyces antarcticus T-34]|uniref:Uncharacterized protein n=1 Tax=Pseudozyma antarctica (strain T-34) TaxID=1151754 RepID=M9MCH5_PSEA3|nr:hypothetical protein PANT_5c00051 [Moesziomyces antarcticus T-34]